MRLVIKHIVTLLYLCFIMQSVFAQTDPCISNLRDADRRYEEGWFDESIQLIESTLKDCKLSKEDQLSGLRTLILAYLDTDQLELAEESAANIMRLEPDYETDKMRDRADYISVFSKYKFIMKSAFAQTDPCISNLRDADQRYEEGWFDESIQLLKSTLKDCKLSKDDQFVAYRMLVLAYLDTDQLEEAENSAAEIMRIQPNYETDKLRDRSDYISVFSKFKATPVFMLGFQSGVNWGQLKASESYSIVSDNGSNQENYDPQAGFQIGLNAEYRIYKSFWVNMGLQFRKSTYTNTLFNVGGTTINYLEDLNYFDVPLGLKYSPLSSRLKPYAEVGGQLSILNSAFGELSRDNVKDIVDRKIQREEFSLGYFIGIGAQYSIKSFYLQAGIKQIILPSNLNKEGTRYENISSVFKYYYLDNDFTMNLFQVNLSIYYTLHYKNLINQNTK